MNTPALDVIYVLIDPRTMDIRYVGKTGDEIDRLRAHIADGRRYNKGRCPKPSHKIKWIASLLRAGHNPLMQHVETVLDGDDWCEAERKWIAYFRSIGCDLTNGDDGGQGWSERMRSFITAPQTGKPRTPDEKRRISVGMCEYYASADDLVRERNQANGRATGRKNAGRTADPAHVEARRLALVGRARSQVANDKQGATLQALDPEVRRQRALKTWEVRRANGTATWGASR